MAQPKIRRATDADWAAMFGPSAPAPQIWSGLVAATDHLVFGLGGIYGAVDGRWWITFARWPGIGMVKTAHQCGKILLGSAKEAGVAVHALADPDIEGSELWIKRLGFEATDETMGGLRVWVRR